MLCLPWKPFRTEMDQSDASLVTYLTYHIFSSFPAPIGSFFLSKHQDTLMSAVVVQTFRWKLCVFNYYPHSFIPVVWTLAVFSAQDFILSHLLFLIASSWTHCFLCKIFKGTVHPKNVVIVKVRVHSKLLFVFLKMKFNL